MNLLRTLEKGELSSMANIVEEIISAIEREELSNDINKYIEEADEFLLGKNKINKPDFIEKFFYKTKSMLISTVNGCIKSRNNPKKKDDLKKYKEGYFNEIIQNANDIVINSEKENPIINIECNKNCENNEYEIICSYPDKGFSLKDIYGFCSRGNSNKSSQQGQEGMYGIGIKSLFCFATYFSIENNIKIELTSEKKILDTIEINCLEKWPQLTKLTIRFKYYKEKENKHAGFNIEKMARFIDSLIDGENCEEFFFSEEESKIVFDPRSLIFTELRNNRNEKNSVKNIKIKGNENVIDLKVSDEYYSDNIKISTVKDDMKYLVFHYPDLDNEDNTLSIAYAIDKVWDNLNDRIYATYFVANYSELLEKKTGCLINTKAINSSRSGLERDNESQPQILKEIKQKGKKTVDDLINILNSEQKDNKLKRVASDILCNLLYQYRKEYVETEEEILANGIFTNKESALINMFKENKLFLGNGEKEPFKYICTYSDKEEELDKIGERWAVKKNMPVADTEENCIELNEALFEIFYRNDCINNYRDLEMYNGKEDDDFNSLPHSIQELCLYMYADEKSWLININLPFINGIKLLIEKRIEGNSFEKITKFVKKNENKYHLLIKQLVARFEVDNVSFDYMGKYSNKNIVNWLFGEENDDNEFKTYCKEYEDAYSDLKKLLESHIRETQYYESNHYNAYKSHWWYKNFKLDKFKEKKASETQIKEFLYLISKDILKLGVQLDGDRKKECLFVHNLHRNIYLWNRRRMTSGWSDNTFRYVSIDFLDRSILNFNNFKLFREAIDKYNRKQEDENFKIDYLRKCKMGEANLELLKDMFKWLSTYNEDIKIDIGRLVDIQSDSTDLIEFTKIFLKDINIRLEKITSKNNNSEFIGYVTNINSNCYEIEYKKSEKDSWKKISKDEKENKSEMKNLIVFYTNSNKEKALAKVLAEIGIGEEIPNYIENFINTDNIKYLSSRDCDKYLKRAKRDYSYNFEKENVNSFIQNSLDLKMEDIFTILSGEMSYEDHCPICKDIPTLNIMGNEKVSKNKNCLVIIMPAMYEGKKIYAKTICCKSCFEEYKVSLTNAEIISRNNKKILKLKSTICDLNRSYDFFEEIMLSPDNWKIIEEFNKIL